MGMTGCAKWVLISLLVVKCTGRLAVGESVWIVGLGFVMEISLRYFEDLIQRHTRHFSRRASFLIETSELDSKLLH